MHKFMNTVPVQVEVVQPSFRVSLLVRKVCSLHVNPVQQAILKSWLGGLLDDDSRHEG